MKKLSDIRIVNSNSIGYNQAKELYDLCQQQEELIRTLFTREQVQEIVNENYEKKHQEIMKNLTFNDAIKVIKKIDKENEKNKKIIAKQKAKLKVIKETA